MVLCNRHVANDDKRLYFIDMMLRCANALLRSFSRILVSFNNTNNKRHH
jgi:hypothetical protein